MTDILYTLDSDPSAEWKMLHMNLILDVAYPPHIDRASDPYIGVFEATRTQLMREDPHCWRCGSPNDLEAHHLIQWAYFNIIDGEKLKRDFPMYTGTTDDEKQKFLNSRYNIRLLCKKCHTGEEGVHKIPDPLWRVRRYLTSETTETTVKVQEKNAVKRVVRKVGDNVTSIPKTISNPLAGMKISSSLRRLLK